MKNIVFRTIRCSATYGAKHVITGLLIVALFSPALVLAETKIGFVNAARVLEEAPQADRARKALEKEFAPRDKAIVAMKNDLKKLEEKLSRDAAIMSESKKRKLERDVLSQKREIKRKTEEFREDLNIRRNESFEKLRKRVFEVIVAIAGEKKFDLIVSDGVVYASKRIDITKEVVDQLKKELSSKKK